MKIFADGGDVEKMISLAADPDIAGFTTNPTLMRRSGVTDYEGFARKALEAISDRPICFEVFADDLDEMTRQARVLASWGPNVYVKVPVTNTKGQSTTAAVARLSAEGVHLNLTAIMTVGQVRTVSAAAAGGVGHIVSVFAGRIADTGRDPVPFMQEALQVLEPHPEFELLWASPREVLNLRQAEAIGVHIITMTDDLLAKRRLLDRDLEEFSLETVRMFHDDAAAAGFLL